MISLHCTRPAILCAEMISDPRMESSDTECHKKTIFDRAEGLVYNESSSPLCLFSQIRWKSSYYMIRSCVSSPAQSLTGAGLK